METIMSNLKRFLTGALTWNAGIVIIACLAILAGGAFAFLGGGFLMKTATFLGGVVALMLGLRLVTVIRGLNADGDNGLAIIKTDPIALAILRGAFVIGLAILAGHAYGQPPTPAAWPESAAPVVAESVAAEFRAPDAWPARFAACDPYRSEIEDAVQTYWGVWQYPDAWAAQLYQESLCDPSAVSPVGAAGLPQFMPATWREAQAHFGIRASPHDDIAIEAGAWYMMRQMAVWRAPRPMLERWRLALASYNAGAGNIIRAQAECAGARDWDAILPCLPDVTGHHARETTAYVVRVEYHWQAMAGGDPLGLPPGLRS
jgi:soluble lytic murein transglycosylase-like protein